VSHLTRRLTLAVVITLAAVSTASAQRRAAASQGQSSRPMIGPQLGIATNNLDFYIGGQFSLPVANQFDFYPSFDIYFPGNNVTVWGVNAEGRYWPRLSMPNAGLYLGGGLNITHSSVSVPGFGSASATDAGLGLLGGWDFKAVTWRPFVQIHVVIGNADRVEFGGGVNFKL
jgi:hypothetical protein